ncbi:DeoR/GlpR family DNA-binding transcription regulator [Paracidovorax wautersii]|uniref:DNA-binding transcriptional regulator of sugar metabolism, DeoR/GlpR family n=1 Tax=Paracidovorax wautersii TaxID=1177982 RepID=A0A1I2EIW8_9BURK|nr:DeoR/GlpR family DNA-binding transcription regulator [Paracidovorax wautersii]SFE92633.1 DNA-binding transcriptional regulator of sugar metabolism, DeoR/GlpR family [Paracidovorax wautersii]
MLQEERLLRIESLLATDVRVSTERIAQELDISRETARRDILALESRGALRRVHGGAVALNPVMPEAPYAERQRLREREKRAIAKAALRLVSPGQTLFMDAGSTMHCFAQELRSLKGLTVVTNSIAIALTLASPDGSGGHRVVLLGGEPRADVQATFGEATVGEIHRFRADIAMLSPVGLCVQQGASSYEHHEAAVAQAMVRQADQVALLADHTKIGAASRLAYCTAQDVDVLVTNRHASTQAGLALLQREVGRLVVA